MMTAPALRLEHDAMGRPVRALLGAQDITHLVVRVQSMTTLRRTTTEVVLCCHSPAPYLADAATIDPTEVPLQ
jgi:hypothetical protein